eukprot:gene10619-12294_t
MMPRLAGQARGASFPGESHVAHQSVRLKMTILASEEYKIPQEKYSVQDGGTVLLLPAMLSSDSLLIAMKPYKRFKAGSMKIDEGWSKGSRPGGTETSDRLPSPGNLRTSKPQLANPVFFPTPRSWPGTAGQL